MNELETFDASYGQYKYQKEGREEIVFNAQSAMTSISRRMNTRNMREPVWPCGKTLGW